MLELGRKQTLFVEKPVPMGVFLKEKDVQGFGRPPDRDRAGTASETA